MMTFSPQCEHMVSTSPICRPCWDISSTKMREEIKLLYNIKSGSRDDHKFCNKTECWDTARMRRNDIGFCRQFMETGACRDLDLTPTEVLFATTPHTPDRAEKKRRRVSPCTVWTPRRILDTTTEVDLVLREFHKCSYRFRNIENAPIALGVEAENVD